MLRQIPPKAIATICVLLAACSNASPSPTETPSVSPSNSTSPSPSVLLMDKTEMMDAVNAFYAEYVACLKSPPAEAKDQVSVWCQKNNSYGAPELYKNLVKGGVAEMNADPVACAQDLPRSFTAIKAGVSNRLYGWVRVEADFATKYVIGARVRQGFDHPLVVMINCPQS